MTLLSRQAVRQSQEDGKAHISEDLYLPVMNDRPPLKKQAEDHLKEALEADSLEQKYFHIRSALQFEECIEAAEQVEHAQTD